MTSVKGIRTKCPNCGKVVGTYLSAISKEFMYFPHTSMTPEQAATKKRIGAPRCAGSGQKAYSNE